MKKLLFSLLASLICLASFSQRAPIPLDTRSRTFCDFDTPVHAVQYVATKVILASNEEIQNIELEQQNGSWCITLTIVCNPVNPQPAPTPIIKALYAEIHKVYPKKLVADPWSKCSDVAWGQPFTTQLPQNLEAASTAVVNDFYNQGYNCVCRTPYRQAVFNGNDWIGWQICVTVTASVTEACPCISQ